jgi:hypothetical protein
MGVNGNMKIWLCTDCGKIVAPIELESYDTVYAEGVIIKTELFCKCKNPIRYLSNKTLNQVIDKLSL